MAVAGKELDLEHDLNAYLAETQEKEGQVEGGSLVRDKPSGTAIAILASTVITATAVRQAYLTRGYWAVGGEWLLVPTVLLVKWLWMDIKRTALTCGQQSKGQTKTNQL